MMRMKGKTNGVSSLNGSSAASASAAADWELRPGGMLVQKRTDADRHSEVPPTITVRVKYGSTYHQISISCQATFGELKKMLTGPTGLHHQDQKLIFKDKERDSKEFLDLVRVKEGSKIVLVEDPLSQERRFVEMRKNAKMEKAAKLVSEISLEVDKLASQVAELESIMSKGGQVAETDVLMLTELLMNQLLKLDGIMADGDVKLQRKMQVRRVQKYVETLDMLKIKILMPSNNGNRMPKQNQPSKNLNGQKLEPIEEQPSQFLHKHSNGHRLAPIQEQAARHAAGQFPMHHHQQRQPLKNSTSGTVVTTQWETFDSTTGSMLSSSTPTSTSAANNSVHPKLSWEFFK